MIESQVDQTSTNNHRDDDKNKGTKNSAKDKEKIQPEIKKISPAVKKLLEEHDLDPSVVNSGNKNDRLTKTDVLQYLRSRDAANLTSNDIERPIDKTKIVKSRVILVVKEYP